MVSTKKVFHTYKSVSGCLVLVNLYKVAYSSSLKAKGSGAEWWKEIYIGLQLLMSSLIVVRLPKDRVFRNFISILFGHLRILWLIVAHL
jgi:hypothetical protein